MEKIILLINRDQIFLDRTRSILKNAGYSLHTTFDLEGALTILSNHCVGLIICDTKLKDIDGLELLYYLKKDPLRKDIPFMFLVPTRQQGDAFKAFELNAVDYLVYPLENEILIDKVDEVFSGSGLKPDSEAKRTEEIPEAPNKDLATIDSLTTIATVPIDVSRDNAIWLPGKIIRFDKESLFIETALFGKPEMFLMARISLDGEMIILNGRIKEITYEDFQKPACIEMPIEKGDIWDRIYNLLNGKSAPTKNATDTDVVEEEFIDLDDIFPSSSEKPEKNFIQTGSFQPAEISKPSYDQRFYYSIIGKQLDNCRAITLINTSSMGGLMQGWDVDQEREVALKIISYHLSGRNEFHESFFKEAGAVSRLNHPNIARIYYFGNSNDILYYATEFIDGQSMEDLVDRHGNLNNIKGLEYMIAVCEVLHHLNHNSIFHRNIKPTNLMVANSGAVKIIDFGFGIGPAEVKPAGKEVIIGDPIYMSPEQLSGKALDDSSDIYSVGATFYHVFTGFPPFEGDAMNAFISAPMKILPTPVKEKNPDIPVALAQIIEKMMAKTPSKRHKNFKSVLQEIKSLHAHIASRRRTPSR